MSLRDQLKQQLQVTLGDRLRVTSQTTTGGRRTDTAAWLILAGWQIESLRSFLAPWSNQLEQAQLPDGRIPIDPRFPEVAWPTALAILAWIQQGDRSARVQQAIHFLEQWRGEHFVNTDRQVLGHDTSINGWPWITATHSWIEPTVQVLLAFSAAGQPDHARCVEARKMILDRQLPKGGWNFGNTTVYGQELRPMFHSTGMALAGLRRRTDSATVARSLSYLQSGLSAVRSPLSLGWGILGLTAWNQRPAEAEIWIQECLKQENETVPYGLPLLCLLYCALLPAEVNPLLPPIQ